VPLLLLAWLPLPLPQSILRQLAGSAGSLSGLLLLLLLMGDVLLLRGCFGAAGCLQCKGGALHKFDCVV
jgi:hypothetical protein